VVDTGIYWLIYSSLPVAAPNRDAFRHTLEAGTVYKTAHSEKIACYRTCGSD